MQIYFLNMKIFSYITYFTNECFKRDLGGDYMIPVGRDEILPHLAGIRVVL